MAIAKRSLVASEVKKALHALRGDARDYDPLLKLIDGARFALLGEATHATHDFYRERAEITKRLIQEGSTAVAVEADWPDAFRVNRYVRGLSDDRNANEALGGAMGERRTARNFSDRCLEEKISAHARDSTPGMAKFF